MTEKQPAVEYDVGVMEGSLLVRRSADGVRITVQPSARRVLDAMVWGAGWWALLIGAALFVKWLISTARHGPVIFWGWNLLLVFSMVAGMASAAYSFLFPIEIELDGGQLTWSWRALTEVKRGSIPRESIKSVAVERVRAGRGPARVWGLTVQFGAYMPFVLLRGSQRELAVIAGALRERLTLSEERHMAVQIPAGCRFERTWWGDGVSILIPPRGKWIVRGAVGVALLAATPLGVPGDGEAVRR